MGFTMGLLKKVGPVKEHCMQERSNDGFCTQLQGIVLPSEYILCYPAAGYVTT